MAEQFSFKSYAWSLGTTSFRMANFHRKVEEQLKILDEFWSDPRNRNTKWSSNPELQASYYDFMYKKGFITGNIQGDFAKKAKTARQKTSGLEDIGLLDNERRLTAVGTELHRISSSGNFDPDNEFKIPKDSIIYLKQLLKTYNEIDGAIVRPYLITGKILASSDWYLTNDEFTYILPLSIDERSTERAIDGIRKIRNGAATIDDIIKDIVLSKSNYAAALNYFRASDKTPEAITKIGMNRDGAKHDESYVSLYKELKDLYINKKGSPSALINAIKEIKNKPSGLWRKLLFKTPKKYSSLSDIAPNAFDDVKNEDEFAVCFFNYMHLFKIKSTLSDYKDLNRRYFQITDSFVFDDGKVEFAPIFKYYFKTTAGSVFEDAFIKCDILSENTKLEKINSCLKFDSEKVLNAFNSENDIKAKTLNDVYDFIENNRYQKFRKLIDQKFPTPVILSMLDWFETRQNDDEIIKLGGGEADVPTMFEYIIGILWYRISGYEGKILDYMNLSLDTSLLPRTHAGGGESDIEYKYSKTSLYPAHTLLIECTLMEGTTQRRGEMEPVSRHLANCKIDKDPEAYCTFVSNNLHPYVLSDFRARKYSPTYRNETEFVDSMKIIPLHTKELKTVLKKGLTYADLYTIMENADLSDERNPLEWYSSFIKKSI